MASIQKSSPQLKDAIIMADGLDHGLTAGRIVSSTDHYHLRDYREKRPTRHLCAIISYPDLKCIRYVWVCPETSEIVIIVFISAVFQVMIRWTV